MFGESKMRPKISLSLAGETVPISWIHHTVYWLPRVCLTDGLGSEKQSTLSSRNLGTGSDTLQSSHLQGTARALGRRWMRTRTGDAPGGCWQQFSCQPAAKSFKGQCCIKKEKC